MRSREVWLLEQIDLVEQLKGEALQTQLHQLHCVSSTPMSATQQYLHCKVSAQKPLKIKFHLVSLFLPSPHVTGVMSDLLLFSPSLFCPQLRGQFDILIHQLENSNSNNLANQLTSCMEK